ncbi:MAG: N-acetylglucosamine-6-phosphate deacetylase [Lachnospiraceae bacterium]
MIIRNASVYTEEGFEVKDIYIVGTEFKGKPQGEEQIIDAEGCYAIPGLTDIHFHGCMGADISDGSVEAFDQIADYEARNGITTIVPATMTLPEKTLYQICEAASTFRRQQEAGEKENKAVLCGIYMEGPFVSKEKMGAQNPAYIKRADQKLFDRMQEKSGEMIRFVAIAPETDGAIEFIRENQKRTVLSVAHTEADYSSAAKAFAAGAGHVTHLYNAMTPFTHRNPGVIGAAVDAEAEAELICDGVHVHPSAVRIAIKLFGEDHIIFISDSMRAAGLADGSYTLGGQKVEVKGQYARLESGNLAGSVTNLMDCMRWAVKEAGIPLETAVKCAAVNSAKSAGIYEKYGSITPGKTANLVLLKKEDLSLKNVILKGKIL